MNTKNFILILLLLLILITSGCGGGGDRNGTKPKPPIADPAPPPIVDPNPPDNGSEPAPPDEDPEESGQRFLTLPFNDSAVKIVAGWYYEGGGPHGAIDYVLGGATRSSWKGFEVVAAAGGVAMQNVHSGEGFGNYVVIRHDQTNSEGENYYTIYTHLKSVDKNSKIPTRPNWDKKFDEWEPVKKGQPIGYAGESGCPGKGIHLHFEVFTGKVGSYAERQANQVDPYDIYGLPSAYPQPPDVTTGSGNDHLWIDNVTRPPIQDSITLQTSEVQVIVGRFHLDENENFIFIADPDNNNTRPTLVIIKSYQRLGFKIIKNSPFEFIENELMMRIENLEANERVEIIRPIHLHKEKIAETYPPGEIAFATGLGLPNIPRQSQAEGNFTPGICKISIFIKGELVATKEFEFSYDYSYYPEKPIYP